MDPKLQALVVGTRRPRRATGYYGDWAASRDEFVAQLHRLESGWLQWDSTAGGEREQ